MIALRPRLFLLRMQLLPSAEQLGNRQAVAITFHKYLSRKHAISKTFCNFVAVNKQNWKVYDYDCNKKDNA